MNPPTPDGVSHGFSSFIAYRRIEPYEEAIFVSSLHQTGTKRETQEIKLLVYMISPSVVILKIDNLCLFWMQLQFTFCKSLFDDPFYLPQLHTSMVYNDRIVYLTGVNSTRRFWPGLPCYHNWRLAS
jgi:hypothetical protein